MALSAHALTTVETVKDELSLTVADFDAFLERKINAVSDEIERYCGRHFERQDVAAEAHAADGRLVFCLDVQPLVTLTSISYDGDAVDSTSYEIDDLEAAMVRFLSGSIDASMLASNTTGSDPLPGTARKLYTFAYTGGYVLPKDDGALTPRTLPESLEEACILEVVSRYRGRGRDRAVTSERALSYSVSYDRGESGLLVEVERRLRPFRRMSL